MASRSGGGEGGGGGGGRVIVVSGGGRHDSLWSQLISEEPEQEQADANPQQAPKAQAVYQRRRRQRETPPQDVNSRDSGSNKENRVSLIAAAAAAGKRVSWNRSLSTRGRVSVAVAVCVDNRPQQKKPTRKGRPPVPKGKAAQAPNFEKEKEYFREVDAFELLEESPSPKSFVWKQGNESDNAPLPHVSSRLEKWLIAKHLNYSIGPSSTLSKILETPAILSEARSADHVDVVDLTTPEKFNERIYSALHSVQTRINAYLLSKGGLDRGDPSANGISKFPSLDDEKCKEIEASVKKLSLVSTTVSTHDYVEPFDTLLAVCEQSVPSTLLDVFSKYCEPENINKVGEGTYGEAFKAGDTVCKIVPIDGDIRVNGEVQKRSEELIEEVVLSRTLNHLRRHGGNAYNASTTFIETIELRVCQGPYDHALIRAWEDWDEQHGSESDHPKKFPEKQRYVVFVLQHGGKDLESFVLKNFDEAQSLLVQVTAALAVAEAAYEFEHRDLHWGNILLSRHGCATVQFTLEGRQLCFRTYGVLISIIDFTLSRINTGEDILFLDLSSDPDLFNGPRGDKQAETYRKMKDITNEFWQGSFPRTNVLWLIYLVDILLLKKSFERSSKNERDLRSLKKRLDKYNSAKEAIFDPFFSDMFIDHP